MPSRLLALVGLLCLLTLPARADMFQDSSNAALPAATINLGAQAVGNPVKFDPLCDGRTTEAEIAAGTAHDCAAALNSAAAALAVNGATANVQLQAGRYYLKSAVSLTSGQTLIGAGRSKTFLRVRDTFDPAAQGVVLLGGGEYGSGIRDLTVNFDQPLTQGVRANFALLGTCTSGSGGTGCKYPPAVLLTGGRTKFENIRVEKAWDGIASNSVATVNSPAGTGAGLIRLLYVEMSALNVGLWIDGPKDQSTIEGFHFWDFGFSGTTALYTGVFKDGTVDCMRVGNVDGWAVSNSFCHAGNVHYVQTVVAGLGPATAFMSNVSLDSGARLIVDAVDTLTITNFSASGLAGVTVPPKCLITMNVPTFGAPRVLMTNAYMLHASETSVCVYGGTLQIEGSRIIDFPDKPSVVVDGGNLLLRNAGWATSGATPRTAPVIKAVSGTLVLAGNTMTGPSAGGGGVAIELTTNGNHMLTDLNFGGYNYSFGCGPTTAGYCFGAPPVGLYDLPDYPFPMSVTPTITGSTDFAPVNQGTNGAWWLRGNKVEFWLREAFDTNAYTTGNNFQLLTTMPPSNDGLSRSCVLSRFDKVAGYTALEPRCGIADNTADTASQINFFFPVPGGTVTNLNRTANILPSVPAYLFFLQGWYPVR